MSVTTYFDTNSGWRARVKSAMKTFFENIMAAREAEARRMVAAHLAAYEDNRLQEKTSSRKAVQASAKLAQQH